ncbi:MAG TPA: hypothetical protein VD833_09715 [Vicinamibacterales bacterium]|nr:hypothetical protein [Vicinamibacterales bacterium]
MTQTRECVVLPALFLTVALLGGVRVGADLRLHPPPLLALTLGLLLTAALARSGVVNPASLMNDRRTALENVSGLIVLLSLYGASAQVFNLVTPDAGLLHGIFGTFFFVQLLTTFASVRDRRDMLRGLVVLLGSAFVLRFIVLESLYAPEGGSLKRVLTALAQAGTLGTLTYQANAPATGYLAFTALLLYVLGLFLLYDGRGQTPGALVASEGSRHPAIQPSPTN